MNKNKKAGCALAAFLALVGTPPGPLGGEAAAQVAVRATAGQRTPGGERGTRTVLSPEKMAALLAQIPDDHPRRDELRSIVREGPPEGFTPEEWLRLAMKFDVRMPGSPRLRQSGD